MGILSIQSLVAYGHAGNSAALFPLQRLGHVTWPVVTVHFSNHTGYGGARGPLLTADDIREVVRGVGERGALDDCEAVLSGYQGAEDVGAAILETVAEVKSRNPRAVYCCDPVMGDLDRGMYVRPGIPEFMRDRVVPAADVVTPNHFELDFLGGACETEEDLLAAADRVRATGPGTVLVTSVHTSGTPEGSLDMVAVSPDGAFRTRTPRLPVNPPGAGDLTAAVFLANLLEGRPLAEALERTTSAVFSVVAATAEAGERELRLVQSQELLVQPSHRFGAARLR